VAESCTNCRSRFRWPVRKLLDTPSHKQHNTKYDWLIWTIFINYKRYYISIERWVWCWKFSRENEEEVVCYLKIFY